MYAYIFSHKWGAVPSQPIVIIFVKFGGLADVIICAKFRKDQSRGFVRLVPENG
jgi:hypothetical protein